MLVDQRADDERLAAGPQLLAQLLVGASAAALAGDDARVDRLAPSRQLAQRARVEIAVAGERERARDRRRGHVQHVRRALALQRRALAHAEAVLLVDDGERERAEDDVGLDQRVRADEQRQLAAGELAEDLATARGARRAG